VVTLVLLVRAVWVETLLAASEVNQVSAAVVVFTLDDVLKLQVAMDNPYRVQCFQLFDKFNNVVIDEFYSEVLVFLPFFGLFQVSAEARD